MKKVAHLLGSLNRGGAETLTIDVLNNGSVFGIEQFICIYRKPGSLINNLTAKDVQIINLRPKNFWDIKYILKLRKLLKEESVAIVHAHQVIDGFLALIATGGLDIKLILTLHGHGSNDSFFKKILRKFVLKKTDLNLYVSRTLINYYLSNYKYVGSTKGCVLYNGIDFNRLHIDGHVDLRNQLKLDCYSLLLGSVGNFTSVRDQITICKFLILLSNLKYHFHFVFIGARSAKEEILFDECKQICEKNNISDKVTFLGKRSDVPQILKQLDAFIYSSSHDTFGLAVVEAIAMGLPVFVNDLDVMLEITDNGKDAIVYETKNEEDLLRKFLAFLDNRECYLKNAKTSAERVRSRFNINHHLFELQEIYKSLQEAQ